MPAAQLAGAPVAIGGGRLRHNAAVAAWIICAYSSFRRSRQKASVNSVMAANRSTMGLRILSFVVFVACLAPRRAWSRPQTGPIDVVLTTRRRQTVARDAPLQGRARDAEDLAGPALVPVGVDQDCLDVLTLHLFQ